MVKDNRRTIIGVKVKTQCELETELTHIKSKLLEVNEELLWAINTIRNKETFGLPDLEAAKSRERRAKGVMLTTWSTINKITGTKETEWEME